RGRRVEVVPAENVLILNRDRAFARRRNPGLRPRRAREGAHARAARQHDEDGVAQSAAAHAGPLIRHLTTTVRQPLNSSVVGIAWLSAGRNRTSNSVPAGIVGDLNSKWGEPVPSAAVIRTAGPCSGVNVRNDGAGGSLGDQGLMPMARWHMPSAA